MAGVGPLTPSGAQDGASGAAPSASSAAGAASGTAGQAQNSTAARVLDEADIRLLDVPAALQILLFETSDALGLELPAVPAQSADQAAGQIIDGFLRTAPAADAIHAADPADPAALAWVRAADQSEAALVRGIERAMLAVGAWRGVTEDVIESIATSRGIVTAALIDEPAPKFLTRPEWLGLAPRIERYRRRRRALRRLRDPDDGTAR